VAVLLCTLLLLVCASCSGAQTANGASANGRAIFQTGRDIDGVQITARSKPLFQKCSACHKADGSGGKRFADGAVSADLRHRTMVHDKPAWTTALLERAISDGIDNENKPLDPVMPRWKLSRRDLHDVAEYVRTQLK
jgi:mono/diheme cytochrome c family protein